MTNPKPVRFTTPTLDDLRPLVEGYLHKVSDQQLWLSRVCGDAHINSEIDRRPWLKSLRDEERHGKGSVKSVLPGEFWRGPVALARGGVSGGRLLLCAIAMPEEDSSFTNRPGERVTLRAGRPHLLYLDEIDGFWSDARGNTVDPDLCDNSRIWATYIRDTRTKGM